MWVASISFAFIHQLNGQEAPIRLPKNTAVICLLSLMPTSSTLLDLLSCIVQDADRTNFILVWSQLRTNSGGISSNSMMLTKSSKNSFLFPLKFTSASLLLAVVAFLWTKFMRHKRKCPLSTKINVTNKFSEFLFINCL